MPALEDGRPPKITSGYGPRGSGFHYGVDTLYRRKEGESDSFPESDGKWIVPDGVPHLAVLPGIVTLAKWIPTGYMISIDHGGGIDTHQMHLRKPIVKVGDRVRAGQPIATIGFSPYRSGKPSPAPPAAPAKVGLNHSHFQLHVNGNPIDPEPYVKVAPIANMPFGWRGAGLVTAALIIIGGYWLWTTRR